MQLEILHPEVAGRDCGHCIKYLYDPKTGLPKHQGDDPRKPLITRHASNPPPCRRKFQPYCPKGTPEHQLDLNPRNRTAFYHFLECEATGQWPDDSLVRYHARLIKLAMKRAEIQGRWGAEERIHARLTNLAELMVLAIKARAI